MTERTPRRRATKRVLRAWAWLAGGLAFLVPWAALGAVPKPAAQNLASGQSRPVVIVRKITRRVIITRPSATTPPVQFVSAGSGSTGSSSGSTGTVSAPAPAPPTSTGGS